MHISLDSALGQQRRLNQVGESITQIAPDPAAAYSLRSLTGGDPKVVRVRRGSDNHEQDFTASDVSSGALQDFVNAQVVAPLDIQALSATGRDGDFLIAKAAYSLRSLGTRQATVTSSGDTDGDTSGKFVCQVRKDQTSNSDDTKSFTATEVSDGTLVDFVLGNTKSLLNSRAYFDGSNDNVKLTSEINLTGDFSLEYSFVVTEATQQIIGKETGGSYIRAQGTNGIHLFRIQTDGSAVNLTLTSTLKYSEANTIKLKRVSGKFGIYNESDVLISNESTLSDTFTVSSFGRARGSFAKGVIYNIRIDTNNDGTINHSYNGYGNTLSDWTDLVGSNNATAVNGSPALFTGQDQDGLVKTWYDQSVDAGGDAHGNHATQATAASQPKIVSAGALLTQGGKANLDFSSSAFLSVSSFTIANASGHYSAMFVGKRGTDTSGRAFWGVQSQDQWGLTNTTGTNEMAVATVAATGYDTTSTNLHSQINDGTNTTIFRDGSQVATGTTDSGFTSPSTSALRVGSGRFDSRVINGEIQELIIYNSDQTDNRTAIEANMGEVYSIDLPSGVDPGFDQVDGFVETWYDQSGNSNDLTQATASKQPTIVTAGALNTRNSEPIIKFIQANSTHLTGASSIFPTGTDIALTVFNAMHVDSSSGNRIGVFGHNGSGNDPGTSRYLTGNTGNRRTILKTKDASGTVVLTQPNTGVPNDSDAIVTYFSSISGGTQTHASFNLGAILQTTITASCTDQSYESVNTTILGSRTVSDNFTDSEFFEVIVYDSNQLSNRNAIEANLSSKYGIALS
jgi:hypothetical protein